MAGGPSNPPYSRIRRQGDAEIIYGTERTNPAFLISSNRTVAEVGVMQFCSKDEGFSYDCAVGILGIILPMVIFSGLLLHWLHRKPGIEEVYTSPVRSEIQTADLFSIVGETIDVTRPMSGELNESSTLRHRAERAFDDNHGQRLSSIDEPYEGEAWIQTKFASLGKSKRSSGIDSEDYSDNEEDSTSVSNLLLENPLLSPIERPGIGAARMLQSRIKRTAYPSSSTTAVHNLSPSSESIGGEAAASSSASASSVTLDSVSFDQNVLSSSTAYLPANSPRRVSARRSFTHAAKGFMNGYRHRVSARFKGSRA